VPPSDSPAAAERVYVLDTHGLIFQMFHGVPAGMTAADGRPTNAVFGVTRAIMDLYDRGADYLLAAFDLPGPTFRCDLDKNYKAHRPPVPPDLIVQEPMIRAVFEAMGIPVLSHEGFEADDVMATLARHGAAAGKEVNLCTSDKDCRQLLGPGVRIVNLRKGETIEDGVLADWGIPPKLVIDFQALVGDTADNVPGVAGCGPKTATKWLLEYGSLDGVIANADKVGGPKLKESLKKAIADGTLALSKTLVTLRHDVPMTIDWDNWKRRSWDGPKLLELFGQYGFRTFAQRVKSTLAGEGAKKNDEILAVAGEMPVGKITTRAKPKPSLFEQIDAADDPFTHGTGNESPAPPKPADDWKSDYRLVDTAKAFDAFFKQLKKQKRFALDLETTSLDPYHAGIVGIAVSWAETEAFYLALKGPKDAAVLDAEKTLAALKPILEDPKVEKVNQNIKYDLLVFRTNGIRLKGVAGDSMIAHYLLHAGARSHGLDDLTKDYLGHDNVKIAELIGKGKKQIGMDQVPTGLISNYACEDADAALRLVTRFEADVAKDPKLDTLYRTVELPLIDVLADLEYTGVRLDAMIRAELLDTIFSTETLLHDGAVIVRDDRLAAAACRLPLTERTDLPFRFGTRHRAALGLSEQSDAVIVVVSEETGSIHVAERGELTPYADPQWLSAYLSVVMAERTGLAQGAPS
jgi:DNA polymerase-1